MNDIKDTAATVTTIAGGGMAVMGINEILTLALLVTGIALNIIRIRAINKDKKREVNHSPSSFPPLLLRGFCQSKQDIYF